MPTNDKRTRARVDYRISVQIEHQSRLQKFYSENLSSGGIFLEVPGDAQPKIGDIVKLRFEIPGVEKVVMVDAEVMHNHSYEVMDQKFMNKTKHGVGLRFMNLTQEDQKVLEQFVKGKKLHVRA